MTDREIVDRANHLAHVFYGLHGCARPEGFRFYEATHPQEKLMWLLAREAMMDLIDTDPDDVLVGLEPESKA